MITLNNNQTNRKLQNHVCPLQLDIVRRVIESWSNPGETVLDTFGSIMTVPTVAVELGRIGIAFELNHEYFRDGLHYLRSAENKVKSATLFDMEEIKQTA